MAADLTPADGATPAPPVETRVRAGVSALRAQGQVVTKVGSIPVVVFADGDRPLAIEDRCPHMGFPLHRGTVETGMVTCHWHHARFDLVSGCTLDPWADDARGFDVVVDGDDLVVRTRPEVDPIGALERRLCEGLEDGLTLVVAKAVLGLLDAGADPSAIVRTGVEFGIRNRKDGWGAGLTVLVAMANVLGGLDPEDRPLALVHGLTFLANDTRGHAPKFARSALPTTDLPSERLERWYRRFVDTRTTDAAERTLQTAIGGGDLGAVEAMMTAAVTDHVFIDGGHTLDFTNKAFEAIEILGGDTAALVLPSLVEQTAWASRSEESSAWRHPVDLVALVDAATPELAADGDGRSFSDEDVASLGRSLLVDDPAAVVTAVATALRAGASLEQGARAVAFAAALRIVAFHTQNEHNDWNTVHHTMTYANALHQTVARNPTPTLARGLLHGALAVYLDRFLNVPAARPPDKDRGDLAELAACWDVQGAVDEAGAAAFGYVRGGGDVGALVSALGHALVNEDAGFHWYQLYEACVRQSRAWPDGSQEQALVLAGFARFLSAHTPTRREQTTTYTIAKRLRRGDALFETT